jgi:hypothetical protein
MTIPFLSLKDITDKYSAEIHEAANRVIDFGWYYRDEKTPRLRRIMLTGLSQHTISLMRNKLETSMGCGLTT